MKLDSYVAYSKKTGKYIGIDENSGGYPWYPNEMVAAKIVKGFDSKEYRKFVEYVDDVNLGQFPNAPATDFGIYQICLREIP